LEKIQQPDARCANVSWHVINAVSNPICLCKHPRHQPSGSS